MEKIEAISIAIIGVALLVVAIVLRWRIDQQDKRLKALEHEVFGSDE